MPWNIGESAEFSNIEIMFLPPKITSQLQPFDSGVIAALKSRY